MKAMNLASTSLNIFNVRANVRLIVLALSLFITACSGSGEEGGQNQSTIDANQTVDTSEVSGVLVNDGTWSLEDKLFISGGERSRTQSNQTNLVSIVVGDDVFDNSNGVYSGGRISIMLSLTGSGVYAVTDLGNVVSAAGNGSKVASINVTAGTLSNNETQWSTTATSGTVTVIVNTEGRYFVSTTEPLILTRKLDVGTGIPGSPDQASFSMRNINGVVIQ